MDWFKNILNNVRESFQEMRNERKEQNKKEMLRSINEKFYLKETSDKIYIMCNGIAVYSAKEGEQASQIVEKMNEMRQTAYLQYNMKKLK